MSGSDYLYLPVLGCARCGEDHAVVAFKAFERPPVDDGEGNTLFTHWGYCPRTGDPILMYGYNPERGEVYRGIFGGIATAPDPALEEVATKYASWPVERGYSVTVREGEAEEEDDDKPKGRRA